MPLLTDFSHGGTDVVDGVSQITLLWNLRYSAAYWGSDLPLGSIRYQV